MKRLLYVRHAPKEKDIIGQGGLDLTQKKATQDEFTDIFYGPLYRTVQTALAAIASIDSRVERVHAPIKEVGTAEVFHEMANLGFTEAKKLGLSNMEALDQSHDLTIIKKFEEEAGRGVQKMFSLMEENGYGICFGHDPIIPLASRAFGLVNAHSIDPLDSICFYQNDSGEIFVNRLK